MSVTQDTGFGEQRKLSVRDASERAGVSAKTVRRAIDRGNLRAFRPAGQSAIVLLEVDVDEWAFRPVVPRSPQPRSASVVTALHSRRRDGVGSVARLKEIERGEG